MDSGNHGQYNEDSDGEEFTGNQNDHNRKLRYIEKINGGLKPGSKVSVIGQVTADVYRIDINLCEKAPGHTNVLHFNLRFNWENEAQNVVVLNTSTKEGFGTEERSVNFPFKTDETFKLVIRCEKDQFHFTVNETAYGTFKYRQGLQNAKYLRILGGVNVIHVDVRS